MRRMERLFGALAGMLGIAALMVTLTQHAIVDHAGSVVISSVTATTDRFAITIPVGLATLATLLLTLSAVLGTRRGIARGFWAALVVLSAALCVLGIYLLGANSVWVNIGGSPPAYSASVSAAALFAPAALMGIVTAILAALAALLPYDHAPARA